jgi:hypothetical protein
MNETGQTLSALVRQTKALTAKLADFRQAGAGDEAEAPAAEDDPYDRPAQLRHVRTLAELADARIDAVVEWCRKLYAEESPKMIDAALFDLWSELNEQLPDVIAYHATPVAEARAKSLSEAIDGVAVQARDSEAALVARLGQYVEQQIGRRVEEATADLRAEVEGLRAEMRGRRDA